LPHLTPACDMSQNSRILQVMAILFIVSQASAACAADECVSMDAFTSGDPGDSMLQVGHQDSRGKNVGFASMKKDGCSSKVTGWNWGGSGRGITYYLDRHTVDCGANQVMKQWNLERGGVNIRINYQCCDVPGGIDPYYEKKETTSHGGDEENLDGLVKMGAVDCGNNLLQKWKLRRTPFEIEYWCAKPKIERGLSGFPAIHGPAKHDGSYWGHHRNLFYLAKHDVECPAGRCLSSWDIRRTNATYIKMVYSCSAC